MVITDGIPIMNDDRRKVGTSTRMLDPPVLSKLLSCFWIRSLTQPVLFQAREYSSEMRGDNVKILSVGVGPDKRKDVMKEWSREDVSAVLTLRVSQC